MAQSRQIRVFDYVNQPYARVRDFLKADPLAAFTRATRSAEERAEHVAAQLQVNFGAVRVATDIEIRILGIEEAPASGRTGPVTHLRFEWKAAESPGLFPLMRAELAVYPLTGTETQLEFSGDYEPPLKLFGTVVDAVVGRRIAEASVHRFVSEVNAYLRTALAI
jgi:hypothetical protein